MTDTTTANLLNRLAGKKVLFNGKFGYGTQEWMQAMAEAQQGVVVDDLDAAVDYLVLPDLSAGKTVQKKAQSLNAKGATIQVMDVAAFMTLVDPSPTEILALIRGGKTGAPILAKLFGTNARFRMRHTTPAELTFTGENFDGVDLSGFSFRWISFENCSFVGAEVSGTTFSSAKHCDFSGIRGGGAIFEQIEGSRFVGARIPEATLDEFAAADFTGADLQGSEVRANFYFLGSRRRGALPGCIFVKANLKNAKLLGTQLLAPNFEKADLTGSALNDASLPEANLSGALLQQASLINAKLTRANLNGANLVDANLAGADLADTQLDGADLGGCNLRGAKLTGANLAKTRNYDPTTTSGGAVGPALLELDSLAIAARQIAISFHIRTGTTDDGQEVGIDTRGLKHGWGLRVPQSCAAGQAGISFSDAMRELSNIFGRHAVRFETVEISSTKSPKSGKELRELVLNGIAEAFAQPVPSADEMDAATKAWREKDTAANAAARAKRDAAQQAAADQKAAAKKQIAKKIAKQVGKVTDVATFLKALELRIEKPKIDKATKMLKASGFKLFNDVTETHLNGVVKSQTDPDLVYACRLEADGHYACCTQNLNICGGLRGSICKHLLVLIVGLVQAGELDPATIDTWIAKTHDTKPELNKETMGEIFIRYKGAEAGEVDWRPTETLPEDYYTL